MAKVTKRGVGGNSRINFIPRFLGNSPRMLLQGEAGIQNVLRKMSPDYTGGFWKFVALSNGGYYMYPDMDQKKIKMQWADNWYEGEMSPEAAGIVACMMYLSNTSMQLNSEFLGNRYHQLREYALDHAEAGEIFKALD